MNDKVFSIIFIIILTITNIIAVILVTGILLVVVALILAKVKPDAMAFFSPVVLLIGILVGTKLYQKLVMKLIRKKGWEIAAIVLCMLIFSFGVSWKEGYHMDELLSFELANARFNPWIVPTQPQGRLAKFVENEIISDSFSETFGNLWDTVKDVLENRGSSKLLSYEADVYEEPVWISGEQFKDYITVDGQDAFQYLSVYFNVKDDNHPPLHFMMLHTVSSLFWGQIRPFMGCIINMAAVAGIMILLMKLGRVYAGFLGMEERGRLLGLFAALLYGLSTGAMATVLLIRMYGVLSFFCVAFFYLCIPP